MGAHSKASSAVTYLDVLRVTEYRWLFIGQLLSMLGDRAAAVAVTLLVFDRTESALLAAAVFAVSYLPHLFAVPLSTIADRFPRRNTMIACDVARAALVGLMVLPGMPLVPLFVLLLLVSMLEPPFDAARAAILPDILEGPRYVAGLSLYQVSYQVAQVAGSVIGGVLVAVLSARGALALDATTFLLSALALWFRLRPHVPPAAADDAGGTGLLGTMLDAPRAILGDPRLRMLLLLTWLVAGTANVAEGLPATYAAFLGNGSLAAGVLAACLPLGMAVSTAVTGRWAANAGQRLMFPMAAAGGLAGVANVLLPGLVPTVVLWTLIGCSGASIVLANAEYMQAVPSGYRARAAGLFVSGIAGTQLAVLLVGGALADVISPPSVVAISGGTALVGLALLWRSAVRHPHVVDLTATDVVIELPEQPAAPAAETLVRTS